MEDGKKDWRFLSLFVSVLCDKEYRRREAKGFVCLVLSCNKNRKSDEVMRSDQGDEVMRSDQGDEATTGNFLLASLLYTVVSYFLVFSYVFILENTFPNNS
jgi:hypothetical protein